MTSRHGVRCFAIDTPGFVGSDPLESPATMSADAVAVVACLDALGVGRTHVFGLHTGNQISAAPRLIVETSHGIGA